MKEVKNMRRDPSCLLSRVLYEISSTVCIQVGSKELTNFGIDEQVIPQTEEKNSEEKETKDDKDNSGKKNRRKKRKERGKNKSKRKKINIVFEETKENEIVCAKSDTNKEPLETETIQLDMSWVQFKVGDKVDCRDRRTRPTEPYFLAEIKMVQKDGIFVHYVGFQAKYDEWIVYDISSLCTCMNECYLQQMHRLAAPNTQNRDALALNPTRKLQKIKAHDTFLLGGTKINGYTQLFQEESKVDAEIIKETLFGEDEIIKFFKKLNEKYIIVGGAKFPLSGWEYLAKALIPEKYDEFLTSKNEICHAQNAQKKAIGSKIDDAINEINQQISYEFYTYYMQQCEVYHKKFMKIVKELLPNETEEYESKENSTKKTKGKIGNLNFSNKEALNYRNVAEIEITLLPETLGFVQESERENILKQIQTAIKKISVDHNNKIKDINDNMKQRITKWKKEPRPKKEDRNFLKKATDSLSITKTKEWTNEEWEDEKKRQQDEAKQTHIRETIKQQNATITSWLKAYNDRLSSYVFKVYGGGKSSNSILHRESIKNQIEFDIDKVFRQSLAQVKQKLKANITESQKDKSSSTEKVKLGTFIPPKYQNANNENIFSISYFKKKKIPPTFGMRFVAIDLKKCNDLITINPMKNMQYKIPQTDKLLYHEMMANGETIMFIRTDMELDDSKQEISQSETKVVASASRSLMIAQKPIITIKRKVKLVSYCESQKLFAILFEEQLTFAVYQQGRLDFTNKVNQLQDSAWWKKDADYGALLIQEVNKNIIVWLIDENNVVRAYEYDTGEW
eukprot:291761_1